MNGIIWTSIFGGMVFMHYFANAFENESLNDVVILEDTFAYHTKRETFEDMDGSGGEFVCEDTDTATCQIEGNMCVCECKPGFYPETGASGCTRGKFFGGQVVFSDEEQDVKNNASYSIFEMFNDDQYFVTVRILSFSTPSSRALYTDDITVTYELVYENNRNVDNSYIDKFFLDQFRSECENYTNLVIGGLVVNFNKSCGTYLSSDGVIICSQSSFRGYCDGVTSECSTTDTGYVECSCISTDDYLINATHCQKQICVSNSDCNAPFGQCEAVGDLNECRCVWWGFTGAQCRDPWLFTLTVVAVGFALIILALIISVCCCASKNKQLKKSSTSVKPYDDEDPVPPFNPSNYQPGLMRARVPGSSYSHVRNNSDIRLAPTGMKNGHSNNAYDTSPHPASTTTFNSPRKSQKTRDPSEYF